MVDVQNENAQQEPRLEHVELIVNAVSREVVLLLNGSITADSRIQLYMRGLKIGERLETVIGVDSLPYRWIVPSQWISDNAGYLAEFQGVVRTVTDSNPRFSVPVYTLL